MPLLTQNQRLNAALADDAHNIAAHLSAAATRANGMVTTMLVLDDAALTDWLNSSPSVEVDELFDAHQQLGNAINTAATVSVAVLAASGISAPVTVIDVRSMADKLAAHGRTLSFVDGVFAVTTPAPPAE